VAGRQPVHGDVPFQSPREQEQAGVVLGVARDLRPARLAHELLLVGEVFPELLEDEDDPAARLVTVLRQHGAREFAEAELQLEVLCVDGREAGQRDERHDVPLSRDTKLIPRKS
jgi:hypothetical protein